MNLPSSLRKEEKTLEETRHLCFVSGCVAEGKKVSEKITDRKQFRKTGAKAQGLISDFIREMSAVVVQLLERLEEGRTEKGVMLLCWTAVHWETLEKVHPVVYYMLLDKLTPRCFSDKKERQSCDVSWWTDDTAPAGHWKQFCDCLLGMN